MSASDVNVFAQLQVGSLVRVLWDDGKEYEARVTTLKAELAEFRSLASQREEDLIDAVQVAFPDEALHHLLRHSFGPRQFLPPR